MPDFFALGDRHVLLFASHTRGGQYYVGTYRDLKFEVEHHGRLNFTTFGEPIASTGDLIAPISWPDGPDRRIMIAWIAEGTSAEAQEEAGWSGILSIPRVLALADDGGLSVEPAPHIRALRGERVTHGERAVEADTPITLPDVAGDCLEIEATLAVGSADQCGVQVRCSPDGSEETTIVYDRPAGELVLDVSRSTAAPDDVNTTDQRAPLPLPADGTLHLNVFVDRSVVELFANRRLCLTKRIYPTRPDATGVRLFARGGDTMLRSLSAWQMSGIEYR